MKRNFKFHMRFHSVFLLLLVLLLFPATGFSLDNDYWNTNLGFSFYPPGARALGMGGAFVGLADDATAAASNPAGIAQLTTMQLAIEGRWVSKDKQDDAFDWTLRNGNPAFQTTQSDVDDSTDVSFGAFTTPLFNNLFNISIFYDKPMSFSVDKFAARGPAGGSELEREPSSTDISIHEAGLSVAKAFCDGRVMLGAGIGVQFFDIKQREAGFAALNDQGTAFAQYFARSVDETEEGVSYRVGLLAKPIDNLRMGASYTRMPQFDYTLKQEFFAVPQLGILASQEDFDSKFDVPDNLSFGAAYNIFPNWVVLFEARYIMYSQLMKGFVIPLVYPDDGNDANANGIPDGSSPDDYDIDNVMEIHFGTEYVLNVIPNIPIALRAGFFYEPAHDLKYDRPDGIPSQFNQIEDNLFDGGDDLMHYTVGTGTVLFQHLQIDVGADITDESRNVALSMVYQF